MKQFIVTEDALAELSHTHETIKIVLDCLIDVSRCHRVQTLAFVANDYVSKLEHATQAMHTAKLPRLGAL